LRGLAGDDDHAADGPQRGNGGDVRKRVVESLVEKIGSSSISL
jgi:hypothetical protein